MSPVLRKDEFKQLTEVGSVARGKSRHRPRNDPQLYGGAYPFVQTGDVKAAPFYLHEFDQTYNEKGLAQSKLWPPGTLCITIAANIADTAILAMPACFPDSIIGFTADPERSDAKYVKYCLDTYKQRIQAISQGTTQDNLSVDKLLSFRFRIPDCAVQQKIAAVLSAYDDLIENNRRRIALLERMAEQIYREWFVRFRFPGYREAKFEKGAPSKWETVPLAKAFRFTGGATPAKGTASYWKDGTINWFTPSDITSSEGMFLARSGMQCTEEGLANCSATLFPPYSVMMTSRATIGAIGINTKAACTNQGFIACIPNERYPLSYLYHWLKLSKPYFVSLCGGSTFPELTKGTFKRIEVLTPPLALVTEFEQQCAPIFKLIETLGMANGSLVKTRDLLLPRLISGKLRVDDLDIHFPPSMQDAAA